MQGRISSPERSVSNTKSTTNSTVTSEIRTAEAVNLDDQDRDRDHFCGCHQSRIEEEEHEAGQDMVV